MDLKERIDALCTKVIAAPEGSEEFTAAMQELRSALNEHVERVRQMITEARHKEFSPSDAAGEG
jgi:hypothetical protein